MSAIADSARALVDPVDGARSFVEARRIVIPLLILIGTTAFAGAVFALRWDAAPSVIGEMTASGDLAKNTEQEIADAVTTAWRTRLVGGIASGIFAVPILVLAFAALLKFIAWLFGVTLTYVKALSVAVLCMLPKAVFHIAYGLSVLRQTALSDKMAKALLPSNLGYFFPEQQGLVAKVLASLDFFSLWGVVLLGMGFSAGSGMRRSRSLLLAFVLFALFVGVTQLGLPALMQSGGGGAPGGGGPK